MKKKKRIRFFALLLTLCMCVGMMPASAAAQETSVFADGSTERKNSSNISVSVAGEKWETPTYAKTDEEGRVSKENASADDYNIFWDAENGVLTLQDALISTHNIEAVSAETDRLAIKLIGDNIVSAESNLQSADFSAISNSGEIELMDEGQDASLSVSVSQSGGLNSSYRAAGIYTGAGLINSSDLCVRVTADAGTDCSGTLTGIQSGGYGKNPAFLRNTGKITAVVKNDSLNAGYTANSYGILLYGGAMTNSGELNFNVSAINGDAYGLRGTDTEESWNNEGTIFSDVIAYGGNFEGVPEELYKASNHACAVSVVSSEIQMTNAGVMNLTARNRGKNEYAEYAIGLELDSGSTFLNNTGTIHSQAFDAYTWGIYLSNLTDNAALINSGNIEIEATTDGGFDGEQIGNACATGIGINMDNFSSDPKPVKTELILESGSSLSVSAHAVEGMENEEDVTYNLCQAIQLQKIYYGGDPGYEVKPQEIILADDLVIVDGGEYDGGEPLTEFLEDYVDLGMYVYINTIGNYFTDSADGSSYSVPSKNVVVLPSLQGTVAIDGTLKVGETLTARISDIPEEAGIVYQWQECDTKDGIFTDISGATESSYTLTSEQKGNYIRVIVTPKEGTGYAGSLFAVSETYVTSPSSGGSAPTYPPQIEQPENGDVSVSPKYPQSGDKVTVAPEPDEGFAVGEVIVTGENGDAVKVADNGDGTYTFRQPAGRVTIQVVFRPEECDGGADCPASLLIDVDKNAWYHKSVDYMIENGMMNGTSETTFLPDSAVTRGMIVEILYRLEGEPGVKIAAEFSDVADGQYYADAVAWAAGNEIVTGYSKEKFGPDDAITREQLAAILYRYAQYKNIDVTRTADLSGYTDTAQISAYAETAVKWANAEGLITGVTDTMLKPAGTATRAQAAEILMRFCEHIAE